MWGWRYHARLKENWEKQEVWVFACDVLVVWGHGWANPTSVAQDLTLICRFVDGCRSLVYSIWNHLEIIVWYYGIYILRTSVLRQATLGDFCSRFLLPSRHHNFLVHVHYVLLKRKISLVVILPMVQDFFGHTGRILSTVANVLHQSSRVLAIVVKCFGRG